MRTAHRLHARLREAEVLDLALADQLLDHARNVLDGHVRVDTVLIEEIDAVGLEPLERCIGHLPDALGPAVHARFGVPVLEAELGRDHDLVAEGSQGLAHHFFVQGTIGFGGVEERHTALEGFPDQRDRVLLFLRRAITEAQPHAAETEGRHLQGATTQATCLHFASCDCSGAAGSSSSSNHLA